MISKVYTLKSKVFSCSLSILAFVFFTFFLVSCGSDSSSDSSGFATGEKRIHDNTPASATSPWVADINAIPKSAHAVQYNLSSYEIRTVSVMTRMGAGVAGTDQAKFHVLGYNKACAGVKNTDTADRISATTGDATGGNVYTWVNVDVADTQITDASDICIVVRWVNQNPNAGTDGDNSFYIATDNASSDAAINKQFIRFGGSDTFQTWSAVSHPNGDLMITLNKGL